MPKQCLKLLYLLSADVVPDFEDRAVRPLAVLTFYVAAKSAFCSTARHSDIRQIEESGPVLLIKSVDSAHCLWKKWHIVYGYELVERFEKQRRTFAICRALLRRDFCRQFYFLIDRWVRVVQAGGS